MNERKRFFTTLHSVQNDNFYMRIYYNPYDALAVKDFFLTTRRLISHAQSKSFYTHRAFSGNCHYYIVNGDPAADDTKGQETNSKHSLPG